jgi:hypothetical protein
MDVEINTARYPSPRASATTQRLSTPFNARKPVPQRDSFLLR